MPREPLPEDLRRFILLSVPSVPFLEALLLFRAARGAPVASAAIARRLYLSDSVARQLVAQLRDARMLLEEPGGDAHRLAPESGEAAALLDMLADFYRTHLVEVTDLIHNRAGRRAQHFADAFKLRKES
jgi:hypothetical protein